MILVRLLLHFFEVSCKIPVMRCRYCGSDNIYRSHRQGLWEGFWLRLVHRAPYRCHSCGARYYARRPGQRKEGPQERAESLAAYLGLRGSENRLRRLAVAAVVTLIFLGASIVFVLLLS